MTDETTGDEWPPGIPDELPTWRTRPSGSATPAADAQGSADGVDVGRDSGDDPLQETPVGLPSQGASPVDRYPVHDEQHPPLDATPDPVADHDPLGAAAERDRSSDSTVPEHAEPQPVGWGGDSGTDGAVAEEIAAGFERVEKRIESLHEDRSTLESMIRGLQSRNEELQGDLVMRALTPIVKELAVLQGQARRIATEATDRFEASVAADVAFDFDDFADRIGDTADALGVEEMGVKAGDLFDRKRHQASGRVPTTSENLDKCVASVIHEGYWAAGTEKPVVYAKVRVYHYEAPEPTVSDRTGAEHGEAAGPTDDSERAATVADDGRTQQDNKENEQ